MEELRNSLGQLVLGAVAGRLSRQHCFETPEGKADPA
jgi:hypothetical protein